MTKKQLVSLIETQELLNELIYKCRTSSEEITSDDINLSAEYTLNIQGYNGKYGYWEFYRKLNAIEKELEENYYQAFYICIIIYFLYLCYSSDSVK